MSQAAIAFGGNLGPVSDQFRAAVARMATAGVVVEHASALYETGPVGSGAAERYVNAAAVVTTPLAPAELLRTLLETETALGRERMELWGPRPIDLDLVWYGEVVCETAQLTLPHPACWYRRFVLDPLCDVCPGWIHPLKGVSIESLQSRFQRRPLTVGLAGGTERQRRRLVEIHKQSPTGVVDLLDVHDASRSALTDAATCGVRDVNGETRGADVPEVIAWLGPSVEQMEETQTESTVARPQSESTDPEFLSLPADRRLDVSRPARRNDQWLLHLTQSISDVPRRIGSTEWAQYGPPGGTRQLLR
ncbi:MAG: 2-amino-4-hydroxy-6-hydroxymethyldihydropteridine diphosphokinase [Planctomycetota bacterium]|nr:2-amino-4-hydroxy-6-hydroxymethyldihydropteridine diphosphokinase [Planctomycetota bacterium]